MWIKGVTREGETEEVTRIGQVKREAEREVLRCVEEMEVSRKRKVGKLMKSWRDRPTLRQGLEILVVYEKMTTDRRRWRKIIASPK